MKTVFVVMLKHRGAVEAALAEDSANKRRSYPAIAFEEQSDADAFADGVRQAGCGMGLDWVAEVELYGPGEFVRSVRRK